MNHIILILTDRVSVFLKWNLKSYRFGSGKSDMSSDLNRQSYIVSSGYWFSVSDLRSQNLDGENRILKLGCLGRWPEILKLDFWIFKLGSLTLGPGFWALDPKFRILSIGSQLESWILHFEARTLIVCRGFRILNHKS